LVEGRRAAGDAETDSDTHCRFSFRTLSVGGV
jgi:hypothetical protein